MSADTSSLRRRLVAHSVTMRNTQAKPVALRFRQMAAALRSPEAQERAARGMISPESEPASGFPVLLRESFIRRRFCGFLLHNRHHTKQALTGSLPPQPSIACGACLRDAGIASVEPPRLRRET